MENLSRTEELLDVLLNGTELPETKPQSRIEEKLHALCEKGLGGGGGSARPDWNQNDETAPDYVKNRPFYTSDPIEMNIVEETNVVIEEDGGGILNSSHPLEVGQEYTVVLDGTSYKAVCKFHDNYMMSYIGNAAIFDGEDTQEPFFIAPLDMDIGTELGIIIMSDVLEHTVSVSGNVREIKEIDEKYIPDLIARVEQVQEAQNAADNAQNAANNAQNAADNAQNVANKAQNAANKAQNAANSSNKPITIINNKIGCVDYDQSVPFPAVGETLEFPNVKLTDVSHKVGDCINVWFNLWYQYTDNEKGLVTAANNLSFCLHFVSDYNLQGFASMEHQGTGELCLFYLRMRNDEIGNYKFTRIF